MGCSDSKSADTAGGDNKPQDKSDQKQDGQSGEDGQTSQGVYVSEGEAVEYIINELGTTEERAKKIVKRVDKNDDGKVSNDELIAMWGVIKEKRAKIKAEFEEMDADKTGYVTSDEAVMVFSKKFKGLPEASIKAMVKRYDTEGQNKLQYDEFIYFYGNMVAKRESLEGEFQKLDPEDKGQLPANDLEQLLAKTCVLDDYMAKSMVEDCDMNKDGLINRQEFQKLMQDMFA